VFCPALQAGVVVKCVVGAIESKNCRVVSEGFMASLKVNLTARFGFTPVVEFAGTVERIVEPPTRAQPPR